MKKSYTILYMDDDHDDLQLITEAFLKYTEKLTIVHAYNGKEGLNLLLDMMRYNELPCLIIIDINMPIMDGKQALSQIKSVKDLKDIPVVMFSTSKRSEDYEFALEFGASFISKPTKFDQMEKLVKQFIDHCTFEVESHA